MKKISTLRSTLKRWIHESGENGIFRLPKCGKFANTKLGNAENLLTRSLVSLKRGYHDWAKSHFQASKMKKTNTLFARYLETMVSRIGRNRNYRPPKCRKYPNTSLGTHDLGKIEFPGLILKKISTLKSKEP